MFQHPYQALSWSLKNGPTSQFPYWIPSWGHPIISWFINYNNTPNFRLVRDIYHKPKIDFSHFFEVESLGKTAAFSANSRVQVTSTTMTNTTTSTVTTMTSTTTRLVEGANFGRPETRDLARRKWGFPRKKWGKKWDQTWRFSQRKNRAFTTKDGGISQQTLELEHQPGFWCMPVTVGSEWQIR